MASQVSFQREILNGETAVSYLATNYGLPKRDIKAALPGLKVNPNDIRGSLESRFEEIRKIVQDALNFVCYAKSVPDCSMEYFNLAAATEYPFIDKAKEVIKWIPQNQRSQDENDIFNFYEDFKKKSQDAHREACQ